LKNVANEHPYIVFQPFTEKRNNILKTKGYILVIADNKQLGTTLKNILKANQFTVDYAVNGEEGIGFCQTKSYDIALVDMTLRNLSGLEVVNRIEKISPSTDCIYITVYTTLKSTIDVGEQKPNISHETKPLEIDKFISIIEQILERKDTERRIKRIEKIKNSIFEISETADSARDLKALTRSIHKVIGELISANNYHIALCENDDELISYSYYLDKNNSPSDQAKKSKKKLKESQSIDWLGVPLKAKNKIIGTLMVQNYAENNHCYKKDKAILSFVSSQLAKKIEHKKTDLKNNKYIKEKNLLIKEIHHHFCNNQLLINGSVKNQTEYNKVDDSLNNFDEIRNCVYSIALVQRELYKSNNLASINCKAIIQKIVNGLYMTYFHEMPGLNLQLNIENIILDFDRAILCGLILNELVSNSLKHAFPATWEDKKMVSVKFRPRNNNHVELIVSDNGVGLPKGLDFRNTKSVGLNLVNMLDDQLNGKISLDRRRGTKFRISFEKFY